MNRKSEKTTKENITAHNTGIATVDLPPLKFLGNHLKKITILVNYENELHLPDLQLAFLTNILAACKLNMGDVAIINTSQQSVTLQQILALQTKILMLFGTNTKQLGITETEKYRPKLLQHYKLLIADSLDNHNLPTENARKLKTQLWISLQQLMPF